MAPKSCCGTTPVTPGRVFKASTMRMVFNPAATCACARAYVRAFDGRVWPLECSLDGSFSAPSSSLGSTRGFTGQSGCVWMTSVLRFFLVRTRRVRFHVYNCLPQRTCWPPCQSPWLFHVWSSLRPAPTAIGLRVHCSLNERSTETTFRLRLSPTAGRKPDVFHSSQLQYAVPCKRKPPVPGAARPSACRTPAPVTTRPTCG